MFERNIRDGVCLKVLEERHASAAFAAVDRNRAYLRKWLPWVDDTTGVAYTLSFIKTSLQQFANNEGFSAGIWCGDEYAGIVTDACRALIDHAFEEWELNRVEIRCAPGNKKSCAIPKRLGFRLEGVLRKSQYLGGKYLDTNVYGMLARDWKGAAK
jgi:ribosomal-protein-serine acetyltransferase